MNSEIDLRVYLRVLRQGWAYIVASTLLFAVIAFVIARFILPRAYTTETLIYLFPPSFEFSLEQSLLTVGPDEAVLRTLTRLVLSDAVITDTIERARPQIAPERLDALRLERLQENNFVSQTLDNRVLSLSVTWGDPVEAQVLATAWAASFSGAANRLLRSQDDGRLTGITAQRVLVETEYEESRTALEDFQATTPTAPLLRELNVLRDQYEWLFRQLDRIDMLLLDIEVLRSVFAAFPPDTPVSVGDTLALYNLQSRLTVIGGQAATPLLQFDGALTDGQTAGDGQSLQAGVLAGQTYAGVLAQLTAYETALRAQQAIRNERIAPLVTTLNALEGDYQAAVNGEQELQTTLSRAREAYLTLVNAEESLAVYATTFEGLVRTGAAAVVPTEPSQPRVLITTGIAAAAGAMFGFVLIFLLAYLRADAPASAANRSSGDEKSASMAAKTPA